MRDPLHTAVCDVLGIRHPVLLAGMRGYTTPELVAAVTRAGGLGVFGAAGMTADAIAADIERALALCDGPVGVNVQIVEPTPASAAPEDVDGALAPVRGDLGIPHPPPPPPAGAGPVEIVEAALAAGARVVSVGLGDPAPVVPAARAAGAPVLAMVATVEDALRAEASGADVLVAQGGEAGGHRSNFRVGPDGDVPLVGTMALVPQVVRAVGVPVVAAGGIMDGRGLVAALALGAGGVQLGTAYLVASEASSSRLYRERLAAARDTDSVVTSAVTGRPARMLRSDLVDRLVEGPGHLGWPRQGPVTADVRAAADRAGRADLAVHLVGQASALVPATAEGAEEITARVMREARETIARLSGA